MALVPADGAGPDLGHPIPRTPSEVGVVIFRSQIWPPVGGNDHKFFPLRHRCEMSEGTNPRLAGALSPDPTWLGVPVSGARSLLNNRASVYALVRQIVVRRCQWILI